MLSIGTIQRFIRRELRRQQRRKSGGVPWVLFEPILTVSLLSLGFSLVLRTPPLGDSFTVFFASGYGVFFTFQHCASALGHGFAHVQRRGKRWWPEALVARGVIAAAQSCAISLVLWIGVGCLVRLPDHLSLEGILLAHGLAITIGASVGLVNCAMFAIFPLWHALWGITSRLLFLASCVLFLPETLPPEVLWIAEANPIVHALGVLRGAIYWRYDAAQGSVVYIIGFALAFTAFGLALLRVGHPVVCAAMRRMSV